MPGPEKGAKYKKEDNYQQTAKAIKAQRKRDLKAQEKEIQKQVKQEEKAKKASERAVEQLAKKSQRIAKIQAEVARRKEELAKQDLIDKTQSLQQLIVQMQPLNPSLMPSALQNNISDQEEDEPDMTTESKRALKDAQIMISDPNFLPPQNESESVSYQVDPKSPKAATITQKQDLCMTWVEQAFKQGQPASRFATMMFNFVKSTWGSAKTDDVDQLQKEYYNSVTKQLFKDYITSGTDMPTELKNASSQDLVMYCAYAMNDPNVSKLGPYTLNDLFFQSLANLKKPYDLPSKLKENVLSYITPRLHYLNIDVDDSRLGTELVDLALQLNFFPQLMDVITHKVVFTTSMKNNQYNQYPSNRKGADNLTYKVMFVFNRRYRSKLIIEVIELALNNYKHFGIDSVLEQFAAQNGTLQGQVAELMQHCIVISSITDHISKLGNALQVNPHLFKLVIASTDLNNVHEAREDNGSSEVYANRKLLQAPGIINEGEGQVRFQQHQLSLPRLTIQKLASLFDILKNIVDKDLLCKILAKGLDKAPDEVASVLQQKTALGMNHTSVMAYVTELSRGIDVKMTEYFDQTVVPWMKSCSNGYHPSAYQNLIAKTICSTPPGNHISIQCKSGMGKTNIILKSCKWYREQANEEPIVVVVNDMLYEQFNLDNDLYFNNQPLNIYELATLTPADCEGKVVFLDEADYGIDNYGVYFPNPELVGVVSLTKAKKCIFLSATYDNFHKAFLRDLFFVQAKYQFKFKSTTQIVHQTSSDDVDKDCQEFVDEATMWKAADALIQKIIQAKEPVMVFVVDAQKNEAVYDKKLELLARKNTVPFKVVDSVASAGTSRQELKLEPTALIRTICQYALGFDLKMQKPCQVIILIRDAKFTSATQIDQMIGRSSREQGSAKGTVLMINPVTMVGIQALTKARPLHGSHNAKLYYSKADSLDAAGLKAAQQIYRGTNWQNQIPQTFQNTNKAQIQKFMKEK